MASLSDNISTLGKYTDPVLAAQKTANANFMAGQKGETQDFLGRYTGAIGAQETMGALADRIGKEQGLPTLRANAYSLNSTLRNIPQVQLNAARGNEVTQNQLDRTVGYQQNKISPLAQEATRQQQVAEGLVSEQMGYAQADQAKQLLPYQMESTMLSDRLARESTLYSTQNQNELNALLQKMSSGVTMTEGELNRANALAIQEKAFENAKAVAETQAKTAAEQNKYISVPSSGGLYNTATGQMVVKRPLSAFKS